MPKSTLFSIALLAIAAVVAVDFAKKHDVGSEETPFDAATNEMEDAEGNTTQYISDAETPEADAPQQLSGTAPSGSNGSALEDIDLSDLAPAAGNPEAVDETTKSIEQNDRFISETNGEDAVSEEISETLKEGEESIDEAATEAQASISAAEEAGKEAIQDATEEAIENVKEQAVDAAKDMGAKQLGQ